MKKPVVKKLSKRDEARLARQAAVAVHNRDLSTEEIAFRITHCNTLVSLYQGQRDRQQQVIREASADVKTCDAMIDELNADCTTLSELVKARKSQ